MGFYIPLGFGNRRLSNSPEKIGDPGSGLRGGGPNESEQGTKAKKFSRFSLFRKQSSHSTVCGSIECACKTTKANQTKDSIPQNSSRNKHNNLFGFVKQAKTKTSSKRSFFRSRSDLVPGKYYAQSEVKPQILVSSKKCKHKLHSLAEDDASESNVFSPAYLSAQKQLTSVVDTKSNVSSTKTTSHLRNKTAENNSECKADLGTSSYLNGHDIESSHFWTRIFSKSKSRKGQKAEKILKSKTESIHPERSVITNEPETHEDEQPKKVNNTKSKICAPSFETKSGTENLSWVQKLCAFATKTKRDPAQNMIAESQSREKKSTKPSSTLQQNGEQKSTIFSSIPFLNTVIDHVTESPTLFTAPASSAFHASSSFLSLSTKRTLFKVTGRMFKSSIGVTSACAGTTAAAGAAILTGDFAPNFGCTGMEEVCKSVCFLGSQTFDTAENWVLEASNVFSGLRPRTLK